MKINVTLTKEEAIPFIEKGFAQVIDQPDTIVTAKVEPDTIKINSWENHSIIYNPNIRNSNKIYLIKMIREAQSKHSKSAMGLIEAKRFVESYLEEHSHKEPSPW